MDRDLLTFYQEELRLLEEQACAFGDAHPKEAGFLRLENTGRSTDPHVERLLQSFALLAARVRLKIDDDFPELTDALLQILYPHYLAPLPSMMVAQLRPNPGADLLKGLAVPRHAPFRTTPFEKVRIPCEYRTVYPVRLWPLVVGEASLKGPPYSDVRELMGGIDIPPNGAKARLRLRFDLTSGSRFADLALGTPDATGVPAGVRLFLFGGGGTPALLYERLLNNVTAVAFRDPSGMTLVQVPVREALRPVGLNVRRGNSPPEEGEDEGVLPYPDQSFPGYRLLTEFAAYREKFLFLDLGGWDRARAAGLLTKPSVEVHLFFNREASPNLENAVNDQTFLPGCTPLVNLFTKESSEGFVVRPQKYDYPLVADHENTDGYEIYSVDEVYRRTPGGEEVRYEPFYAFRHQDRKRGRQYWYAKRRLSPRTGDRGTEIDLHFVDLDFDLRAPAGDVALARLTCTNRDLPTLLTENKRAWELNPLGVLPATVKVVTYPTVTLRPMQKRTDRESGESSSRKMTYWRLISHLSLNHLSLGDADEGRQAIQEYLALYDFGDDQYAKDTRGGVAQKVREGVLSVGSKRDVAFVPGDTVGGYARGMEVALELDEDCFVGVGAFLFGSVMDRFFALYASINSFTKLALSTRQRGLLKTFPPRAGDRPLV